MTRYYSLDWVKAEVFNCQGNPTNTHKTLRRGKCIVSGISAECCWIRLSWRGGGHEETDKGSHVLRDGLLDIMWSSEMCRLLWETKAGRKVGRCSGKVYGSCTPSMVLQTARTHRRWSGSLNHPIEWCLLFNLDFGLGFLSVYIG